MARIPALVRNEVAIAVFVYPEDSSNTVPFRMILDYGRDSEPAEYRLDEDHPYRVIE